MNPTPLLEFKHASLPAGLAQRLARTVEALATIADRHAPAAFANSLGAEDMVLTDLIAAHAPAIAMFTLDTGRLHEETYALIQRVRERYALEYAIYCPDAAKLQDYVNAHGVNGFYHSVELRTACCHLRKVEPLRRALAGKRAWITGLRREQASTRRELRLKEWDTENGLLKFNPLADWTQQEVWAYLRHARAPWNPLHDRGYPSIGCAPCTRAVAPGEDVRAGRWWWESPEHKECGLHPSGARRDAAGPAKPTDGPFGTKAGPTDPGASMGRPATTQASTKPPTKEKT